MAPKPEETVGDALKFLRDLGYLPGDDVRMPRPRFEDLCAALEEITNLIETDQLPRAQGMLDGLGIGLRTYLREGR